LNKKLGKKKSRLLLNRPASSEVDKRDTKNSLFHYTTAAGLIGIIQTQTLWAMVDVRLDTCLKTCLGRRSAGALSARNAAPQVL